MMKFFIKDIKGFAINLLGLSLAPFVCGLIFVSGMTLFKIPDVLGNDFILAAIGNIIFFGSVAGGVFFLLRLKIPLILKCLFFPIYVILMNYYFIIYLFYVNGILTGEWL